MAGCRFHRFRLLLVDLMALFALTGCTVLKDGVEQPPPEIPAGWLTSVSAERQDFLRTERFWTRYTDPALSSLIERVLRSNNDIKVAALKIKNARLTAGLAFSDRLPTPSAGADSSRYHDLKDSYHSSSHSLAATISYELDFWHKYSGAQDVAELESQATQADYVSSVLSLIETSAELYWQISYLNQVIQLDQDSCDYRQQSIRLLDSQYAAGAVSRDELVAAQQDFLRTQQELKQNQNKRKQAWHALAILLDQPPSEAGIMITDFAALSLPQVAPGLPASILRNRPDLRAAELRLRKLHEQIAVTQAQYYPSITLTGSLGSTSEQLREVLQNPVATLGAGLTLPFLEWNQTRINVAMAKTDYESAVIGFRQTVYSALCEVEDALSDREYYQNLVASQAEVISLAGEAQRIAETRYQAGATGVQDLLDAQEALRTARLNQEGNKYSQLQNSMTLYLALGGGDLDSERYVTAAED